VDRNEIGPVAERTAQGVVELVVPDLPVAVAFYVSLCVAERRRSEGFAVLHFADALLFLAEDAGAGRSARWVNLRIVVADVDRLYAHVQQLGVPLAHPLADRGYGLRDFTVRDPFGFDVRFAQVLD